MLSGAIDRNVPHHHRKGTDGGTGIKPSDLYCVPLTYNEHILVHSGQLSIESEHALRVIVNQAIEYLIERDVK